jgi:hypothetical protein
MTLEPSVGEKKSVFFLNVREEKKIHAIFSSFVNVGFVLQKDAICLVSAVNLQDKHKDTLRNLSSTFTVVMR